MKKQILVRLINECIEEILNESKCNCNGACKCDPSLPDHTPITKLPSDLKIGGDLKLKDTPITKLPNDLKIGGNLKLKETENLGIRLKTQAVLRKYTNADDDIVIAYVNSHPTGVTLKQFEIDAKQHKWTTDTTRAIAVIMSKLKK